MVSRRHERLFADTEENGDAVCRFAGGTWQVVTVCVSDIWRGLAERSGVHHARPAMKSPGYETAPDNSG